MFHRICVLFFLTATAVNAATFNWLGTTSDDWATAANWDQAALPSTNDQVYIDTTATNIATITGNADTISLLRIGNNGATGQLDLKTGATLNVTGAIDLGISGGHGTLSIAGGSASTNNKLTAGNMGSGSGTVTVTQGGILNTLGTFSHWLGASNNTSGAVTVSGAGSQWNSAQMIVVGVQGTGTLHIADGGAVEITAANQEFIIADHVGATGRVTIDGTGSSLTLASGIVVGTEGSGEIHIRNGGRLDSASGKLNLYGGVIGGLSDALGGTGVVTIEGKDSHWENRAGFYVGATGSGTLNLLDGGTATGTGQASIGGTAGYPSQATVSGDGTTWTVGTSLNVADGADGTLLIADGGQVISQSGAIGNDQNGTVILRDATSSWDIATSLTIGSAHGNGTLLLGAPEDQDAVAAGRLDAASLILYATGTLLLNHTDNSGAYTLSAPLSGNGAIIVVAGTTTLSGDNSAFAGTTTITGGRLIVDRALAGAVDIAAAGTLGGTGTIDGPITSEGIINPEPSTSNETFATLTIGGDFNGGTVHLDTALGGNASPTDQLIILGNTSGDTTLQINNVGGNGAATTGNGILVIQVGGISDGVFSLAAPLTVGKFTYTLEKGADGHWYLQSRATPSTATAIPVNHPAALALLAATLLVLTFATIKKRYR